MVDKENPVAKSKRENLIDFKEALQNLPKYNWDAKEVEVIIDASLNQWDDPIVDGSPRVSDDTPIRHYVSLPKFMSIIEGKRLWLSSVAGFDDNLEGALTQREESLRKTAEKQTPSLSPELPGESRAVPRDINAAEVPSHQRDYCLVNCWRIGQSEDTYHESAVFWNAYIPDGIGVAIESRVGKLKEQFTTNAKGRNLRARELGETVGLAGAVRYIDPISGLTPHQYPQRLLCKRGGFKDEREYRIVLNTFNIDILKSIVNDSVQPDPPSGEYLDIHPPSLIEHIYLSPNAPGYLLNVLKVYVNQHNGLSSNMVSWSDLHAEDPMY